MGPRFSGFRHSRMILGGNPRFVFLILMVFFLPCAFAAQSEHTAKPQVVNENTSASLEMITERMKALSGSLASIPEPPRFNQVIQIPEEGFGRAENSAATETEKETKK